MNVTGEWFRWSAYDINCGIIVPAEGATLEAYDPWVDFSENEGKYRTVEQPYSALLDLGRRLYSLAEREVRPSYCQMVNFLSEPQIGPRNEADAAILEWVNAHGLLGILPVTASEIRCPVREENDATGALHAVSYWRHFRAGGEWVSHISRGETFGVDPQRLESATAKFREGAPPPGAHVFDWKFGPSDRPAEWVREFFLPVRYGPARTKPEPFSPPCPGTREFAEAYCEPLQEFVWWVDAFLWTALAVSQWDGEGDKAVCDFNEQRHWFMATLAQSAAPSFALRRSRTLEVRQSAGLLASFALMFLWDRTDKRRALECAVCGKHFISDEFRAAYCSEKCRNTASKRRARARKAEQRGE